MPLRGISMATRRSRNSSTNNPVTPVTAAKRGRLSRTAIVGFALALVATIAALAGAVWFASPRQNFDMVKTLAELKANEGAWDNPWDKTSEKISSVKLLIAKE